MECKHCGAEVGIEYRLCPYCKSEIEYPNPNRNQPIIIQNIIQSPADSQNYNQNYNQAYNQNQNYNYNQGYQPQQNYNPQQPVYMNNIIPQQDNSLAQISPKSKVVTLLLAIFLGLFGIHRFYAGKYISGLVYMFSYGIGYVGWIFDIIMIATGKFKDKDGLPIQK